MASFTIAIPKKAAAIKIPAPKEARKCLREALELAIARNISDLGKGVSLP
jgi:hypothetical protein